MWKQFNNNPVGRSVGDCAVRAVSVALDIPWEEAYTMMAVNGCGMGDMPSGNSVWGAVLRQHGFYRYVKGNAILTQILALNLPRFTPSKTNCSEKQNSCQNQPQIAAILPPLARLTNSRKPTLTMTAAQSFHGLLMAKTLMRCGRSWTSCYLSYKRPTRACLMV